MRNFCFTGRSGLIYFYILCFHNISQFVVFRHIFIASNGIVIHPFIDDIVFGSAGFEKCLGCTFFYVINYNIKYAA